MLHTKTQLPQFSPTILKLSSIWNNWGHLPFSKYWVFFHNLSSWVKIRLHTENQILGLPRTKMRSSSIWKTMRSSSVFQNIYVILHFSSSWVKIRLHTENQLPGLTGNALKVCVVVGWWLRRSENSILTLMIIFRTSRNKADFRYATLFWPN